MGDDEGYEPQHDLCVERFGAGGLEGDVGFCHFECNGEGGAAEENPCQADTVKRRDHSEGFSDCWWNFKAFGGETVQGEGDAVECSPNDEIPGGTVSESSEEQLFSVSIIRHCPVQDEHAGEEKDE